MAWCAEPTSVAPDGGGRDAASGEWHYQIKNTFVDIIDAPGAVPGSPRAHSDPGARNARSSRVSPEGRRGVECKPIAASAASGGAPGSEPVESWVSEGSAPHATGGEWPESEEGCRGEDQDVPPPRVAHEPGVPADSAPSVATSANQQVAQWLMCRRAVEHSSWPNAAGEPCFLPSAGSVGHSLLLCSHSCKNLLGGHCKAGAQCGYCHLPHCQKKLAHLDKKNRAVFDLMGAKDKVGVMWPALQQRVQELGMGTRAAQVLLEWRRDVERALLHSSEQGPATKPAEQRRLSRCLCSMRLAELCAVPKDDRSGPLRQYTEGLLSQIRVMALAHGQ